MLIGAGVALALCLLLWAFSGRSSTDGWNANAQLGTPSDQTNADAMQQAQTQGTNGANEAAAFAQQQAQQQRQVEIAAQRDRDRAWSRKHFAKFVSAYPNNDHSVGTFGGISAGTFTVANAAGYRLRDVMVMVNYYTPGGKLINTNSVSVSEVPAKGQAIEVLPASERGVSVSCNVIGFSVPGLDYKYNIYVDETDIGNPN